MGVVIGMGGEGDRGEAALLGVDAEFLMQLAHQRGLGRLAGVNLAAGELPQAGHGTTHRALGEQHSAVDVDQRRRGHQPDRRGGWRAPVLGTGRTSGGGRVWTYVSFSVVDGSLTKKKNKQTK